MTSARACIGFGRGTLGIRSATWTVSGPARGSFAAPACFRFAFFFVLWGGSRRHGWIHPGTLVRTHLGRGMGSIGAGMFVFPTPSWGRIRARNCVFLHLGTPRFQSLPLPSPSLLFLLLLLRPPPHPPPNPSLSCPFVHCSAAAGLRPWPPGRPPPPAGFPALKSFANLVPVQSWSPGIVRDVPHGGPPGN